MTEESYATCKCPAGTLPLPPKLPSGTHSEEVAEPCGSYASQPLPRGVDCAENQVQVRWEAALQGLTKNPVVHLHPETCFLLPPWLQFTWPHWPLSICNTSHASHGVWPLCELKGFFQQRGPSW